MRIVSLVYDKIMTWSRHHHAPVYLFGLSFAESSFFRVPPDVMLAPMVLANPARAWYYASVTIIASVLGSIVGYLIGFFFFTVIHPYIIQQGYGDAYAHIVVWFHDWGFWAIIVAAFAPIPFRAFTIVAGASGMMFLPFLLACAVGRGSRFALLTALMLGGGRVMQKLFHERYIRLLWLLLVIVLVAGLVWYTW